MFTEDIYLLIPIPVMFVAQLCMCLLCKRMWQRMIPTVLSALSVVACFVAYGVSGYTNWAFLILAVLLFFALAACGVAWLIYGVIRILKKSQVSRKNT